MQKQTLGIELGSTRIKAVLIDEKGAVLASGAHDWGNTLKDGYWTYALDDVWGGIADAFSKLTANYTEKSGETLTTVSAMGVSAMMHGYLAFDKADELLIPFRTWRNTNTTKAAEILTDKLKFNIPERWSVAHLYQCILDGDEHVKNVDFVTTLAGYVHYKLTGEKVIGVGDASGMFPIDSEIFDYDKKMLGVTNALLRDKGIAYNVEDVFPKVMVAGKNAGRLSTEGAKLLDPSGVFGGDIPLCPPEGDAGTGMVATGSVAQRTGNVSAGTSVFAMIVLEKALSKLYREIDMVTTPCGSPVAMVHCNTCTSDLDAWVNMMYEAATLAGSNISKGKFYDLFYAEALKGAPDCDGLLDYNFYAGEPVVNVEHGAPLFFRRPDSKLTFANFARAQIYATMAVLKIGMDILFVDEKVTLETLLGHGGLFKAPIVGQKFLAGALNVPVAVTENAGEGGPWGIALLAGFMLNKSQGETLGEYLKNSIFNDVKSVVVSPEAVDVDGFAAYIEQYKKGLAVEMSAGKMYSQLT